MVPSPSQAADEVESVRLPEDVLIIIPVRNLVLFPGIVMPIAVGREQSIAAAQEAARTERPVGLLLQRDAEVDQPEPTDLYTVGTAASILRYVTDPDGGHHLVCHGDKRFRVVDFIPGQPFLLARVERLPDDEQVTHQAEALAHHLRDQAVEAVSLLPQAPPEMAKALRSITSATALGDIVAGYLDVTPQEKQEILQTLDTETRLQRIRQLLDHRVEVLRLQRQITEQTKESLDERQREAVLREQLRTIQRELGEDGDRAAEVQEIAQAITDAGMPEEVEAQARKELKRLERMPEGAGEYGMLRTYLDWLIELPWSKTTAEAIEIDAARRVLDEDHYGLDKIKRRILEHLAVRKLNPEGKSPILCFVGPPGVGKTSLGQSIARAMGRQFERVSLGGVHDEAEVRGHRRTYIGALPGNMIQAIRKAGTRNPLIMLDEMDKLGAGVQGDPSAALLEVLDPEQNATFRDNYLAVPFDLSKVMFIGTANVLDNIPGPLRDRMEVIELPGYTEAEKVEIARRYLVPRQLKGTGLTESQCGISDSALHRLVQGYTREAGCRNLEREIGAICRSVAMRIAEGTVESVGVNAEDLPDILGPERFESEVAMRTSVPGVATGLAWTPVGGDVLFIEASRAPGKGRLILTGQLGEVMKESAQAALSLIKSRAMDLGLEPAMFDNSDIHVHVPAGAIPKDGPSAGVAMFTALLSLLTERTVRHDVAMTGEITLRGLVLPVGGIKEKVLAAHRAGIKKVLLPARNRKDYEDIPQNAREQLEFVWLETVDQVISEALGEEIRVAHADAV
ncbi:MAG: endopeptidase La [Pseudomonadota bacterium]|nr:endopeptidase La [Pseudomonadota bacterium]